MDRSPYEHQPPFVPPGTEPIWDVKPQATGLDRPKSAPVRPRRPGLY